MRIRLLAASDRPVWFSLVGFGSDLTDAEITAIVTAEPRPLDETVAYTDPASFVLAEPGSEGEMTWVFVEDSLRWSSWCTPKADSGHPGAGLMYGAADFVLRP